MTHSLNARAGARFPAPNEPESTPKARHPKSPVSPYLALGRVVPLPLGVKSHLPHSQTLAL